MPYEQLKVRVQCAQQGFTLIEFMIAMLIGVFLLGALLTIVQTNRAVFGSQNQLAQLQDSERMALSMIADVVQSAGYFPSPISNTQDGSLTVSTAPPFAAGQAIYGTYSLADPGDTISIRYMTQGGDGILNCSGQSNPTGGPNTLYVNTFSVSNAAPNAGQLICTLTSSAAPAAVSYSLVSGAGNSTQPLGVTHLTVLYGVKTSLTSLGNNVDTYLRADQVTDWNSIISVQVTLTFTNPLYVAGQGQPASFNIQRVIGVMNQVGPTL